MNKVTLRNQKEFEANKSDYEVKPQSIKDAINRKALVSSLKDNGINDFKEVTDFNAISFGHFILIEKILALELDDSDEKVRMIAPIILRPLGELKLDNEDAEKESAHKEKVLDEPIGNIVGSFNRLLEIRHKYLYSTYNGVIYGMIEDADEDEEEGTNISTGTSAREFHSKKFFWNSMISDVAGGDIFKFNEVVDLMMYVVMPFLAEKRSLAIVERLEHKASMI